MWPILVVFFRGLNTPPVVRRVRLGIGSMCGLAASMRRQGLTGLNTHPRPSRRGGRDPVAHEDHCGRQWDKGALDG